VVSVQYAQFGTPAGYTLEIFTVTGESLGVTNVEADGIRKPGDDDLPSTRSLSASA
jgi:hypothetical protein